MAERDPVDELRTVVGVEAKDFERELLDQAFQERNEMRFVDPLDATDLRYWMTRVIPDGYPEGFSNPLFIDIDGNGWTPPGLRGN